MSATITGGPSRPSHLLANAQAVSAGATLLVGPVDVTGFRLACVEVVTDQASNTLSVRGTGSPTPAATLPLLRNLRNALQTLTGIAVDSGANGSAYLIDVEALAWLQLAVTNGAGSGATVTVRVTLA